ncbi:MAG: 50S ribosomal protein L5 [Planctomycetota bacterium]|nr:50S ribosomal protein L5 [Planctomycetota bacterium]
MSKDTNKPQGADKPAKAEGAKGSKPAGKGGSKPAKAHDAAAEDLGPKVPPRLKVKFDTEVRAKLGEQFGLKNPMAQPRLDKIVLNVNMGRHLEGSKLPPHVKAQVLDTLVKVTGQKPVVIKAKKSVSNFKVREGFETAAMVTIRRERMWHFLDRLINLATPRIKDFQGVSDKAFDRQGNYAMGVTEQGVFPEINMADAQFTHGMHINMCFRNSSKELSKFVLAELGMPFVKPEKK